jgi:hypothetical protein
LKDFAVQLRKVAQPNSSFGANSESAIPRDEERREQPTETIESLNDSDDLRGYSRSRNRTLESGSTNGFASHSLAESAQRRFLSLSDAEMTDMKKKAANDSCSHCSFPDD